jgi:nitronate monooxygenase
MAPVEPAIQGSRAMPLNTTVTAALGIRHPVLLAPMDIVADARLTAAVSAAGGFGILGGGYGDEAWLRRELGALPQRGLGPGAAFGVGFITWSLAKHPELLDMALAAKPRAVMLSFGDPGPFADRIKAAGALMICQVQSEALAKNALAAGADMLVAQGAEAGGHGSSRGTLTLVPAVVDLAGGRVPVIAAGGIADGRGLAACLMLGAGGVLIGTRFYASEEAAGHDEAKQRICGVSGDDTVRGIIFDITRRNVWPAPFTGRCLANEHTRRWAGREIELLANAGAEAARYDKAKAAGDFDIAAVIAGEASGLVHDVPSAAHITERMVEEAAQLLDRRRNSLAAAG